jgi:hypothetical protein
MGLRRGWIRAHSILEILNRLLQIPRCQSVEAPADIERGLRGPFVLFLLGLPDSPDLGELAGSSLWLSPTLQYSRQGVLALSRLGIDEALAGSDGQGRGGQTATS